MRDSTPQSRPPFGSGPQTMEGIPGSPGYAVGSAIVLDLRQPGIVRRHVPNHLVAEELERFSQAVRAAADGLKQAAAGARARGMRPETSILEAYVLMVEDETLRSEVERHVLIDKLCAEWALSNVIGEMAGQLGSAEDEYLAERKHDIEFVGKSIARALSGRSDMLLLPQDRGPGILVSHDLSPAETAGLTKDKVLAIVTEGGTRTSHTAILARALDIPAVVGVPGLMARIGDGDNLIVDGGRGRVTVAPDELAIEQATEQVARYHRTAQVRRELRDRPVVTRCGMPIELKANIELPGEAEIALEQGARGVGLYRTEFLYLNRNVPPNEDEQYATYRRVVEAIHPYPVTIRTFDIGGDKAFLGFRMPHEQNPALGLRAVRLGLARKDVFSAQLRAIVRASTHGDIRLMVPMIASMTELRAVRELFERALVDVDNAGHARAAHIPLGIMVEVPSTAILADRFAEEVDFMSIGTNDLVQYALAVDRGSPELAHLASFLDPAILRLIRGVVAAGSARRRPVIVCGAMASDPLAVLLLIGLGLRELSLEASAIPDVRDAVAQVTLAEAEDAAEAALSCLTAREVEDLLQSRFGDRLSAP
ncbi:MAG TPA: phosphoenolpyruvate--protein phosphotransferase [Polyangiaceae bacterium]|nr:phosphoenolpyruvate--protein phosphotransferase [Polyangiaceae bacterium]